MEYGSGSSTDIESGRDKDILNEAKKRAEAAFKAAQTKRTLGAPGTLTLAQFLRQNGRAIDRSIRRGCADCTVGTPDARELWVRNDSTWHQRAIAAGVRRDTYGSMHGVSRRRRRRR